MFEIFVDNDPELCLVFTYKSEHVAFDINFSAFTSEYLANVVEEYIRCKHICLNITGNLDNLYMVIDENGINLHTCNPDSKSLSNLAVNFVGEEYIKQMIESLLKAARLLIIRKGNGIIESLF
jgi:hypothetical protein